MDEWDKGYDWDEDENQYCNRECYDFNTRLKIQFDDNCCEHCRKYLTLQCEYLEDFMDEIEDLSDVE